MYADFIKRISQISKFRIFIITFLIWQYFCIAGIALLNWPNLLIWLNLLIFFGFIVFSPIFESILLLVSSIPFYVVVPNLSSDTFVMWRVLFAILFIAWLIKDKKTKFSQITFLKWDKYLGLYILIGLLVSLVFGHFKIEAIKYVLFLLNIYLLYIVVINSLKTKKQILELIRYTIWALVIIVTFGFTQLFGSFMTNLDTFWVFWAVNLSKLYYGMNFASVALFSNSWFSYTGGRELRMFSIMPDSQSFAYVCLIGLCVGTALTRNVFVSIRKWLWSGIRFAALGLILSGTRAVWVGMLVPFSMVLLAYYKNFHKNLAKKFIWPFLIILILFGVSPFINKGLTYLRVQKFQEKFLQRVASIYNLNESSNRGRIEIWQSTIKFAVKHPLGIGFGNFLLSFQPDAKLTTYKTASKILNSKFNLPSKYISAHSLYLQTFVEAGIFGFFAFSAFWFVLLKYFWKFLKEQEKSEDFLVYFVAQAFLMVLWILGASIFDITLLNDKVLMLFLVNIGISGVIVKNYKELVK